MVQCDIMGVRAPSFSLHAQLVAQSFALAGNFVKLQARLSARGAGVVCGDENLNELRCIVPTITNGTPFSFSADHI